MAHIKEALGLSTALLTTLLTSSAWAQAAPPPASPAAAPAPQTTDTPAPQPSTSDNLSGLDDIVVTAQRRSENLQRVPIVVTTASGDQLAKAGISSLQQLNLITPGLNSKQNLGTFQPSIRGIGTTGIVVENPVALYIDGVYLPQQREGLRDLPDVAQIAVLKGPQGTLFGRNATGGVIQITTLEPTSEFKFKGELGLDNYATFKSSAYVSGGLADSLTASLSAQYSRQGKGYGTNLITDNGTYQLLHAFTVRGKLVFSPSSATKITLTADYLDRAQRAQDLQPVPGTRYVLPIPPTSGRYDLSSPLDPTTTYKGGGVSLTIDQDVGFAKLLSISSYRKGNATYSFDNLPTGTPYFDIISPRGPNHSFTQEVQLISRDSGGFKWNVGIYYFSSYNQVDPIRRILYPAFYTANGAPLTPTSRFISDSFGTETSESYAPFGQVAIKVLPATTLTLGARYNYEKRRIDGYTANTLFNGTVVTLPRQLASQTVRKPTWRIALDHQFSPDILGYVSYNRGIKSGGYNINSPSVVGYDPETLDAYEAGLKMDLFDKRLRLNIGGFYYDYSNLQVSQYISNVLTIVNGPKAQLYGVDVDFQAILSDELRLSGGFEAMHNKFVNFPGAAGSIPKPGGGATLVPVDASGNRLPGAQNFVATGAIDYTKDTDAGKFAFNFTANYNGSYYFEADNRFKQKSFIMLNASLTWTMPDEHVSVSIWGRNLADETVATLIASQAGGYTASFGTPPRTYGVTVGVKF